MLQQQPTATGPLPSCFTLPGWPDRTTPTPPPPVLSAVQTRLLWSPAEPGEGQEAGCQGQAWLTGRAEHFPPGPFQLLLTLSNWAPPEAGRQGSSHCWPEGCTLAQPWGLVPSPSLPLPQPLLSPFSLLTSLSCSPTPPHRAAAGAGRGGMWGCSRTSSGPCPPPCKHFSCPWAGLASKGSAKGERGPSPRWGAWLAGWLPCTPPCELPPEGKK